MPTLTIQVTEKDIEDGQCRDTWTCPVCLALFRSTGFKFVVEQTTCYALVNRNAPIPLPPEAIKFIRAFDASGHGKPFEFQLEMP
ncbi:MAG: hypothetical protein JWN74_2296 [Acidobacteriaceae bacterium]|nr:hypothetical protein [Acidobacteriaceae bacterium]